MDTSATGHSSGVSKFQIFSTYLGDLSIRAQIVKKMKKKDALPLDDDKMIIYFLHDIVL